MGKNPEEKQEINQTELLHNLLLNIAERFDPALDTIRTAHNEQHLRSFFLELLISPFKNVVQLFKVAKVKGVATTAGVFFSGYLLSTFEPVKEFVMANPLSVGFSVFLLWYATSAFFHFLNMAKLDRKDIFHIVAFRTLRKAEYQLFEPFVKQKTQIDLASVVQWFYKEIRNEQMNAELAEVRQDRDMFLQSYSDTYEDLQRTMEELHDLTIKHQDRMKYLYKMISGQSRNVTRVSNNIFDITSLNFIAPYTLYRLVENTLVYVGESGTSGNSPVSIDVSNPEYQDYAAVKAIQSPKKFAQTDAGPLQNRKVASFFVKLTSEKAYVVNFHLDEHNLFFEEDETRSIISLRSIHEIVESHCRLMDKLDILILEQRKEEKG
ncbi:hypothetical protein [Brevibacillus reuszeri]|uniref:hypothetical protein n=1 Tax=Brevibacillus reuszeri TaxID=54915 RepID=UPI000CCC2678|nr:hypothetical protein [Brevibacillus reuszeri]